MAKTRKYILSIAGYDPSGGAGVLADVKTFEQHKLIGLAVPTCNTLQNDNTFISARFFPSDEIIEQIKLLSKFQVEAVKIGLVENLNTLQSIVSCVKELWPKAKIVLDPVLKASASNESFWSSNNDLLNTILKEITLVTPNNTEWLTLNPRNEKWPCTVLLTGSDSAKPGEDVLLTTYKQFKLKALPFKGWEKHGSGCILSSALAANLAKGYPILKAALRAKTYTTGCLNSNSTLLAYHK